MAAKLTEPEDYQYLRMLLHEIQEEEKRWKKRD